MMKHGFKWIKCFGFFLLNTNLRIEGSIKDDGWDARILEHDSRGVQGRLVPFGKFLSQNQPSKEGTVKVQYVHFNSEPSSISHPAPRQRDH